MAESHHPFPITYDPSPEALMINEGAAIPTTDRFPTRAALPVPVRRPSLRSLRVLIVPLLLLGLWQLMVEREVYRRSQLPAPLDVYRAGRQLESIDQLWIHIQVSTERVFQGFMWGAGIA